MKLWRAFAPLPSLVTRQQHFTRSCQVSSPLALRFFHSREVFHDVFSTNEASSSSLSSSWSLDTPVVIRNASTVQGRLLLNLPLPGLKGLTPINIYNESKTVQDLIQTVQRADPTLKTVEVTNKSGKRLARTVQLNELTGMDFVLRLNHVAVLIENFHAKQSAQAHGETLAFSTIKSAIENDSRQYLPLEEYYDMCTKTGAEEAVANKWLRELQRRNLVVHFDRSTNEELRRTILLRPNSGESYLTIQNAMDSELYNIKHARKVKQVREHELRSELRKLEAAQQDILKQAKTIPNTYKWVTLTALGGFYTTMMYAVWDVYSWDVMEPITYFIGFTVVLGNSFHHTITKKEATYTNVWQKKYLKRVQALQEERRLQPARLQQVRQELADVQRDLLLLQQFENKPRDGTENELSCETPSITVAGN